MHAFFGLILAGAVYLSTGPAHAQTTHPVDLDGEVVNFVVPEGYCVLDRSIPTHLTIFEHYYGENDPSTRVVMFFVNCDGLAAFTTIGETLDRVSDNGVYYTALDPDGSVTIFPAVNRGELIRSLAEQYPDLPLAAAREGLSDALADGGGPPIGLFQSGLTSYDSDALYVSLIATSEVSGNLKIVGGGSAITVVHDRPIFLGLSRLMEDEEAIDQLSDEVRQLMAAFLDANPDSDN